MEVTDPVLRLTQIEEQDNIERFRDIINVHVAQD